MFMLQRDQIIFPYPSELGLFLYLDLSWGKRARFPHFIRRPDWHQWVSCPARAGFFVHGWLAADLVCPSPAAFWLACLWLPNHFDKSR